VFYFLASVIITRLFPKLILPIFFKPVPLSSESPLRSSIFELFKRFNIKLKDVYVLDFSRKTVKANAMVAGLGAAKQIYLSDTLVKDFTVAEVSAVLAHEIGHYVRHDTFKMVAVSLAGAFVSFWAADLVLRRIIPIFGFEGIFDIAALPLLLLVLITVGLVLLPLSNGFVRSLERSADLFSLKATRDKENFISMMTKLGERNYSDFSPSRITEIFLYDHPPIKKRIEMAKKFEPKI
ncbi:MAG TPA: M48 family metalloprotease, partial [Candidatus Omnitrophota bacterium]|nr:M48 family metalloprotease [Candidatus Omnitrophota bacterium]